TRRVPGPAQLEVTLPDQIQVLDGGLDINRHGDVRVQLEIDPCKSAVHHADIAHTAHIHAGNTHVIPGLQPGGVLESCSVRLCRAETGTLDPHTQCRREQHGHHNERTEFQ